MSARTAVGVYHPASVDTRNRPVCDWDEDSTTLAVEAARLVIASPDDVRSLTIVARTPTYLVDDAQAVVATALRLRADTPVIQVLGSGPAALRAVAASAPGDVVVALDAEGAVGAAAVIMGSDAARPTLGAQVRHSLPQRVRRADSAVTAVYDDARLMRERGWRPALEALGGDAEPVVTGMPSGVSSRIGGRGPEAADIDPTASWAALAALGEQWATGGRVVALDGASGAALDVTAGEIVLRRSDRESYAASERLPGARIAISLPAYERAFDAKVGLVGSRCACGADHFPPRRHCPVCGRQDETVALPLSHEATVYSVVTVRTPLPGLPPAYSLAIVDLADSGLRALVHITGATAGTAEIGQTGRLVLRKVAEREGVPDYGYALAVGAA